MNSNSPEMLFLRYEDMASNQRRAAERVYKLGIYTVRHTF